MNTMSVPPEPTSWYAIATSPLRAYFTSGTFMDAVSRIDIATRPSSAIIGDGGTH